MRGWSALFCLALVAGCVGTEDAVTLDTAEPTDSSTLALPAESLLPPDPVRVPLKPRDLLEIPLAANQPVVLVLEFEGMARQLDVRFGNAGQGSAAYVLAPNDAPVPPVACQPPDDEASRFISLGGSTSFHSGEFATPRLLWLASSLAGTVEVETGDSIDAAAVDARRAEGTPTRTTATFLLPPIQGGEPGSSGMSFEAPVAANGTNSFLAQFSVFELAQAGPHHIETRLDGADGSSCADASADDVGASAGVIGYNSPGVSLSTGIDTNATYLWSGAYRPTALSPQGFPSARGVAIEWPPVAASAAVTATQTA